MENGSVTSANHLGLSQVIFKVSWRQKKIDAKSDGQKYHFNLALKRAIEISQFIERPIMDEKQYV